MGIQAELDRINEGKKKIAEAVTAKGVETANEASFDTISENIRRITSNGVDTSDATATKNDIAYGKTAYVNGEKILGNVITAYTSGGYIKQFDFYSTADENGALTVDLSKDNITLNEIKMLSFQESDSEPVSNGFIANGFLTRTSDSRDNVNDIVFRMLGRTYEKEDGNLKMVRGLSSISLYYNEIGFSTLIIKEPFPDFNLEPERKYYINIYVDNK